MLLALLSLDVIGINVVGVLAGLGLGGLAIAFAAQKTLENVFGAIAIAGDRPFQVGDFVTIGTDQGTVEDVGLRSTRLRTQARTVVSIPNGVVVAGRVENFSARDRIVYNPTIGLVYDTRPEQLRAVLDGFREVLRAHPRVFQESFRVRFRAFARLGPAASRCCAGSPRRSSTSTSRSWRSSTSRSRTWSRRPAAPLRSRPARSSCSRGVAVTLRRVLSAR